MILNGFYRIPLLPRLVAGQESRHLEAHLL
jgi:hypothetical protein